MLKILLITFILLAISFAGLAIRILLISNSEFSGGKCSGSEALKDSGISCGCGGEGSCMNAEKN